MTLSSDGNGSIPAFDAEGNVCGLTVAGFDSLLNEVRDLNATLPLEQCWPMIAGNVAQRLKLPHKGEIAVGNDADLLLLSDDLHPEALWANGRLMLADGDVLVRGTFE